MTEVVFDGFIQSTIYVGSKACGVNDLPARAFRCHSTFFTVQTSRQPKHSQF